jgi:hypothetical protein
VSEVVFPRKLQGAWQRRLRPGAASLRDLAIRWSRHRRGDAYSSYVLAERAAHAFMPNYVFSEFGLRWLQDEEFRDFYTRYVLEPGRPANWHSADRKYFMRSLLRIVGDVAGDMAECGVYRGAGARLMALAMQDSGTARALHLFDSFAGLSEPDARDGDYWKPHDLRSPVTPVHDALRDISISYTIHEGWIPDRFVDVAQQTFCFVHIDVDLFQPTLDALEFFYPRLATGGVILLDDHGFTTCPGATAAAEQWAATVREPIIDVPTGQAFVIKR